MKNHLILSTDRINWSSFLIDLAARKKNSVEMGKTNITYPNLNSFSEISFVLK